VKTARDNLDWGPGGPPPLLVKVAPDLSDVDKADIAAVILDTGVDGLVVSNTTISRPGEAEGPTLQQYATGYMNSREPLLGSRKFVCMWSPTVAQT
jgi:dihydroorotate dehydrogenase